MGYQGEPYVPVDMYGQPPDSRYRDAEATSLALYNITILMMRKESDFFTSTQKTSELHATFCDKKITAALDLDNKPKPKRLVAPSAAKK